MSEALRLHSQVPNDDESHPQNGPDAKLWVHLQHQAQFPMLWHCLPLDLSEISLENLTDYR